MKRSLLKRAWILVCLCSSNAQAREPVETLDGLTRIAGQTLVHSRAYSYLEELSDGIGPRLTGSPEVARATQWALHRMQSIGLKNAHLETWRLQRGWRRVRATGELVSPIHLPLNVVSLGWAGSTKRGGVEADVVLVDSDSLNEELKNASRWSAKILFLAAKGNKPPSIESVAKLEQTLKAARQANAIAVIREPLRPGTMLPHTDPSFFADAFSPIPAIDMAREHRDQIGRLLKKGKPIRIKLEVENQVSSVAEESSNVVGEIPGSEHPEQVVILGAHLDSWNLVPGLSGASHQPQTGCNDAEAHAVHERQRLTEKECAQQ